MVPPIGVLITLKGPSLDLPPLSLCSLSLFLYALILKEKESKGLEVVERRLMDLVPAPAVRLMKSRVKSRPGVDSVQLISFSSINYCLR